MSYISVAACTLPSVPLDFQGNRDRIIESIRVAKAKGATLRTGPELEIPGYGCLDHHLEGDTFLHSWEVLAEIIADEACKGMLVDVGLGVRHRNVRYNCRALCTYKKIFFLRPKMALANDGLYREMRHFTAWAKPYEIEDYYLEDVVSEVTGQSKVPIGDAILSCKDTAVACETCEELFTPLNPSSYLGLDGAEVILNSSASHAELRKLHTRLDLISNATRRLGGVYVYSNMTGVDGDARMMFDGSSMVLCNGDVLAQGLQFSLRPVEVVTATVDIEKVRSYRSSISRNQQGAKQRAFPRVECDLRLGRPSRLVHRSKYPASKVMELKTLDPMEEIANAQAVFLWQYLSRTNSPGYFLPLSGGLDSSTVALFVYSMARMVLQAINEGEQTVLNDLRRITGEKSFTPSKPEDIVSRVFHTCYMGTVNSGEETRSRAERLAKRLGAYHSDIKIDDAVIAHENIIAQTLGGFRPKYSIEGGSPSENLARQNIQARNRLVVAYELAQLSTTARDTPRKGAALLVLGSGNVDENLRGYYTKYDASSADIAPLGSISKTDAKSFQAWARDHWDLPIMTEFIEATPSAELLPLSAGVQDDESDAEMGFTYDELSQFGILRKVEKLGPWSTYQRLLVDWRDRPGFNPRKIADKVMRFFRFYSMNRHKTVILTPSPHLSAYNPDDNRHDLRPFLYVIDWPWQFKKIRDDVDELEREIEDEKSGKRQDVD